MKMPLGKHSIKIMQEDLVILQESLARTTQC